MPDANPPNPNPAAAAEISPALAKRAKRRRIIRHILVITLLGLGVGGVVLTQGPIAGLVIGTAVSRATGAQFSAGWTSVRPSGRVIMTDAELRVPGIDGPGGQLLRAARIEVELDWWNALAGDIEPTALRLFDPVIRLSQNATGRLNLLDLPLSAAPGASTAKLPRIEATGGRVEVGEHDAGAYTELARVNVNGWIIPSDQPDQYALELRERVPSGSAPGEGVVLSGGLDLRRGEGRASLNRVDLAQWTPERVPAALRSLWRQLNIRGRITSTTFEFTRADGIAASIELQGVALDLPLPADRPEFIPADKPLSMSDVTGRITFRQAGKRSPQGGIDADLSGRVEDLPARVILNTDGLDPFDAGIQCQIISEQFEISRQPGLLPFMPPLMRKRLAAFSGPTAVLDAQASVRRAPAMPAIFGPPPPDRWSAEGSVRFSRGRAAFEQFPYPIFDLEGYIRFDDEAVRIVSVTGRSASGAALLATGKIWPPDEGDYTQLNITVTDAPMDDLLASAVDRRGDLASAALEVATPERLRAAAAASRADPNALIYPILLGPDRLNATQSAAKPAWAGLYQALFSRAQYDRIVQRGLVLDATRRANFEDALRGLRQRRAEIERRTERTLDDESMAAALDQSIAALQQRLTAPDFALGGRIASMTIAVDRDPHRHGGHYDTDIVLKFEDTGLLPEAFPLPLSVDRLDLRIRDEAVYFNAAVGRGIRGGHAEVAGKLALEGPLAKASTPELHVKARGLSVDDLLINAIPERLGSRESVGPPDTRGQRSATDLLSALNLRGRVDCDADIAPLSDGGLTLDVRVDLDHLVSFPDPREPDRPTMALSELTGRIRVTDTELRLEGVTADLRSAEDPMVADLRNPDFVGPPAFDHAPWPVRGRVRVDAQTTLEQPALDQLTTASVTGFEGLDLALPIEDLLGVVSENAAAQVEALRAEYQPEGELTGEARVELRRADTLRDRAQITLRVDRADRPSVNALGGRLELDYRAGGASVHLTTVPDRPVEGVIAFAGLDVDAALGGDPAGRYELAGGLRFKAPEPDAGPGAKTLWRSTDPLGLNVTGSRFDATLIRAALGALAPDAGEAISALDLRGRFDAHLAVARTDLSPDAPWSIRGDLIPATLGLTRRGQAVDFDQASGRIHFDGSTGRIDHLRVAEGQWWIEADGSFSLGERDDRGWSVSVSLTGAGRALDESLLSLLPADAALGAAAVELAVSEFDLKPSTLVLTAGTGDSGPGVKLDALLAFSDASAQVGVPLTQADGVANIRVDRAAALGSRAAVNVDLAFDRLIAAGLSLRRGAAELATGAVADTLVAPNIFAECHGGRLSGSAVIRPGKPRADGAPGPREYDARITLAGARFADMVSEIQTRAREAAEREFVGPRADTPPPAEAPAITEAAPAGLPTGDRRRGWFDGEIALSGAVGDLATRRGRGSLRIGGGNVIDLPLLFPLMQLSNLQLPNDDKLDFVHSSFYVRGDRIVFDELAALAESLSVLGWGEMRLSDFGLNLRFNSRSTLQIPLWSPIIDGVRNELVTTRALGTLAEPRFTTEQFSGTRRLIESIFGSAERLAIPDLEHAETRARAERRQFRRE